MKIKLLKPLVASLLVIGCVSAQAAHFEVLSYNASTRYTGTADFDTFNDIGSYVSSGNDYGTLATATYTTGSYEHSGLAYGAFLGGGYVDLTTSVSFKSANEIDYYGIATAVEKTIELKVVGDTVGQMVNISFAGLSSTVNALAGSEGTYQTKLSIAKGSNVLANFSTKQFVDQSISFSFMAQAGDTLILSASQGVHMNATGPIDASLTGMLSGNFTLTAVPEPEQYAMLLAGLGLIGGIARRRNSR